MKEATKHQQDALNNTSSRGKPASLPRSQLKVWHFICFFFFHFIHAPISFALSHVDSFRISCIIRARRFARSEMR